MHIRFKWKNKSTLEIQFRIDEVAEWVCTAEHHSLMMKKNPMIWKQFVRMADQERELVIRPLIEEEVVVSVFDSNGSIISDFYIGVSEWLRDIITTWAEVDWKPKLIPHALWKALREPATTNFPEKPKGGYKSATECAAALRDGTFRPCIPTDDVTETEVKL